MPKPWRLAKSLTKLREQINLKWPNRAKASDGSIGNAEHASRKSDHNPYLHDSRGQPIVTAIDVTHDPVNGPDGLVLATAIITDPRVKYLIWNHRIWKSRTGAWEPYRGSNAHTHHVHVSVKALQASYDDEREWVL